MSETLKRDTVTCDLPAEIRDRVAVIRISRLVAWNARSARARTALRKLVQQFGDDLHVCSILITDGGPRSARTSMLKA